MPAVAMLLTEHDYARLKSIADEKGVSVAEAARGILIDVLDDDEAAHMPVAA